MIAGDIDQGAPAGRVIMVPSTGVDVGSEIVYGSARPYAWANGGLLETEDISWLARSWQARGGQSADSLAALRILLRQLEVLAQNPDMQAVYFQFGATASGEATSTTEHDGWYLINSLQPDYRTHFRGPLGPVARVKANLTRISGPTPPGPLGMGFLGSALSSTYTATPVNLIALPLGATGPSVSLSRVGGEGTVPVIILPSGSPNPCPVIPSATLADLLKGGVRCYDSVAAGGNAVDTTGTGPNAFVHQTWVQIYGPGHKLTGDLIITNGLWLLRVNQGGIGIPDAYLWNTLPGTPAWQQVGSLQYKDSAFNVGTIRSITLDRVGLRSSRATVVASTSAGHFARVSIDLDAGHLEPIFEFSPLTQANSVAYGIDLALSTAVKIVANESAALDVATNPSTNLNPSASAGWAVAIGGTANLPLVGLLWQSPPQAQPAGGSTTDIGFGRTSGPAQGAAETFALFATAFTATPANLFAEAEGGTLGTGWTSTADAGSSGGNAAKCASGTASTNADLWGTAWQPPTGKYDVWIRLRVASVASGTSQMQIGLWNSTDSVFVASTTYAPNAAGLSTSYVWVRVAQAVTPTAAKNMRFRAVTTATTTTDWFLDQAVLVPLQSATLGQGNFPADIWAQFAGRRRIRLVRGA